ncbi:6-carboxy-5,6,7,8-tetrahydropterin synthase [mine drainage metagenome]|uniref:6-carboxy-5,6,7,8-tetrahydropterin synthase n=1 Tax=mine drainage metagenome TaxID=410659 RepID=A0A1J5SZ05_9ZZZZ
MPFRIAKTFTVESGHLLTKHPGACRFPHGHSRTVEVVIAADTLDEREMVCDFKAIKQTVSDFVHRFDHSIALNTRDPHYGDYREAYGDRVVPFEGEDPTSEAIARMIFEHVKQALANASKNPVDPLYPVRRSVRLERVRVTETATTWAEYWE